MEDDVMLNDLLRRNLALVGHTCYSAMDGKEALSCLGDGCYDLMILDIMLPELDGFEVMAQAKDQPTIFLTAKDGLSDRLSGFSLGADDYLTKPFEMLELLARVEVVLRHTKRQDDAFALGDVRILFERRQAYRGNTRLDLTPKEFELLDALVRNRNIALFPGSSSGYGLGL